MPRLVTLILALIVTAGPVLASGLTVDQLLDLEQVRTADLSPDGKWVAYTVSQNRALDEEAGSAWSRLYLVATAGGDPRPFVTGEASVSGVRFSPDGRYLGFLMKRGDKAKTQVWVLPIYGGEAKVMTDSKAGVSSFAWSHDGAALFTIETEDPDPRQKKLKDKGWLPKWVEEDLDDRLIKRAPFDWDHGPHEASVLVDGLAVWSMDVGATGRYVAFGASQENLIDHKYMFQDIYLLDLVTGKYQILIDLPGKIGDIRLSPDEKNVAYTAASRQMDHAVSSVYAIPVSGGEPRALTPEKFEGHIQHVAWRDSKRILYAAKEFLHTSLSLQRIDRGPDNRLVIYHSEESGLQVGLPSLQLGREEMALVGHSATTPREVYLVKGKGQPRRLTTHNPWLKDVTLAKQEPVRYPARDGLMIEGLLIYPVDYQGGTFPLIVGVHGGPESNHDHGWISRYANPGQAYAAQGYGVFYPNYRGSTGRGFDFAMSSFGDPAGAEFDDVVDGVEYLIDEGLAQRGKIGVMGGSYGGYATNWLVTKYSEHFQAGVSMVGVSDLVSKTFNTDIPYENEYVHRGTTVDAETIPLLLDRSPIMHVADSKTPLLLTHGENDPRVHPSQSLEMFRAMKMAGHPSVRLIWYPGEGHGNRQRFGRQDFVLRTLAWFDWYLKDGKPWDGDLPPLDLSREMGLLPDQR
jgi:dipeptidyl aminopeptidase/acylaminoacyl peptidase